jgi:hypothetical protein
MMRLTLRTLLAYLDDVLEPSEAKEIGKKLQESPVATSLVSRIREVMRRRRLGAADLEGPGIGIDPNLVAQYLDNTLPADQVAEVEKICLESDQQLAEVAACHQILTLALGEPVEIAPSSRERLYVLGPVEARDKLQTGGESAVRGNGVPALKTPISVTTIPGSAGPSFEETLPDYLKHKPWSGKLVPIVVGVLLIAVWLGAIYSDANFWESLMGLRSIPAPMTEVSPLPAEQKETPVTEELAQAPPAEPEKPAEETKSPVPMATKATETPKAAEPPPATVADRDETSPADAAPEPQPPEPPEPTEDLAANVARRPMPQPPMAIQYVSQEAVLLQLHPTEKNWYVVPKQADLKPGMVLACPDPFEAVLEFDHGAMRITLLGDSAVEILKPGETGRAAIQLIKGRMILQTSRRDEKTSSLGLLIGPRSGRIEFGTSDAMCGLEFLLKEPVAYEQRVLPTDRIEGMYVLTGSVGWAPSDGPVRVANKDAYLSLLTDQPPIAIGPPRGTTPEWLDPQRRKVGSILRRFAKQFEKEFEPNQPIESAMRALIRAPRPQISELAVRCLALTDNYQAVVQALAQADHEDTRKAAINGLRLWLGVRADRGPLLKQALQTYYERPDQIEALYRLLWGISVDEAKTQQASLELVEWLRSDQVEIRELAFANLVRLTGRKFDYRPLASLAQREPAVKRWYDHVLREGALIKGE